MCLYVCFILHKIHLSYQIESNPFSLVVYLYIGSYSAKMQCNALLDGDINIAFHMKELRTCSILHALHV